uniref:Uncharacterized protein n=1 Tax=Micrurus paraensis TaxID=1970185 RepID=A0A2D4L3J3_9SAUR
MTKFHCNKASRMCKMNNSLYIFIQFRAVHIWQLNKQISVPNQSNEGTDRCCSQYYSYKLSNFLPYLSCTFYPARHLISNAIFMLSASKCYWITHQKVLICYTEQNPYITANFENKNSRFLGF